MPARTRRFNTYILKYVESISLDNISELKLKVNDLDLDCKLQNVGSDNRVYYLCQEVLAGYTKEGAMVSAKVNFPDIPADRMMLFDTKGKRLKI